MAIDVEPVPADTVPQQAYVSKLYTAADIEAMIEMLQDEPVLLGSEPMATERGARHRANTLRRYLAEYDVQVTSRTWPEMKADAVLWRWCVILKEAANGA